MIHLNRVYEGNALEILRQLPSKPINMAITSPPYWSKRNYGTNPSIWGGDVECDHDWVSSGKAPTKFADKRGYTQGKYGGIVSTRTNQMRYLEGAYCTICNAWMGELGLEPSISQFVDNLCSIFDEVYRVLRDDGSLYLNIGDTYYGSGAGQKNLGKHSCYPYSSVSLGGTKGTLGKELPKKSLCFIPQRTALELSNRGWIIRNVLIWHKPNAMPESVKDRYTQDFEYMYFLTKKHKYYFEQQFEPYTKPLNRWGGEKYDDDYDSKHKKGGEFVVKNYDRRGKKVRPNPKGRNKRAVWSINTKSFKGAHFATFPEELVKIPILASCPTEVCQTCEKPRVMKYERIRHKKPRVYGKKSKEHYEPEGTGLRVDSWEIKSLGKTGCECADYVKGIVLDPFAGAGTSLKVAHDLDRNFVGIELNPEYIDIIGKRLGFDVSIDRGWEV